MRLAFLVVYLAKNPYRPVFERHLEYLERYAPSCDWWVEAVAHRAEEAVRDRLRSHPRIRLHGQDSIPSAQVAAGSGEHALYLDALMARALESGATHLCTLDDDSFPVRADWLAVALGHLAAGHAFMAPLRAENGDTDLPHPSFLFTDAAFVRAERPTFLPAPAPEHQPYRQRHRQPYDTGIGFAIAAHRAGRSWAPLLRSNARDDHPIMSGLYGDIAFHFGGANRPKVFRHDLRDAQGREEVLAARQAARLKNEPIFRAALRRVTTDMDGYLTYLRGVPSAPPGARSAE